MDKNTKKYQRIKGIERFCTLIRHNENAKIPEIYVASIQEKDNAVFNFKEKGENLLGLAKNTNAILKEKIRKINEDINQA